MYGKLELSYSATENELYQIVSQYYFRFILFVYSSLFPFPEFCPPEQLVSQSPCNLVTKSKYNSNEETFSLSATLVFVSA